jgi:hypothetical protein
LQYRWDPFVRKQHLRTAALDPNPSTTLSLTPKTRAGDFFATSEAGTTINLTKIGQHMLASPTEF